jgi:phosphoribosylformylglycinamidine synthase PurS subunit
VKYEVRVQLKEDVLNVEAKEVLSAINSQGFPFVSSLETSRVFTLQVQEGTSVDDVQKIAKDILCNQIIENFTVIPVK